MAYKNETMEELKNHIYNNEFEQFKWKLNFIQANETVEVFNEYLYGTHDEGRSLLMWVARRSVGEDFINYLINDIGINTDHVDSKGWTAHTWAVDNENNTFLELVGATTETTDH